MKGYYMLLKPFKENYKVDNEYKIWSISITTLKKKKKTPHEW